MVDFRAALWGFETTGFRVEFHAEPEDIDPADSFEFEADIAFARENDRARSGSAPPSTGATWRRATSLAANTSAAAPTPRSASSIPRTVTATR